MKKPSGYEKTLEIIKNTNDMPTYEAICVLVDCAKKGYALASEKAISTIGKLNHPAIAPSLISLYDWAEEDWHKRDRSCGIRLAIVEVLGESGSTIAIDTLHKAIRTVQITRLGPGPEDVAVGLRAAAAIALAQIDTGALYELSLLLFDTEPNLPTSPKDKPYAKAATRQAAAKALRILGDSSGTHLLAIKLKFPESEVSEVLVECIESLIAINPPYLMEIVKPYLTGEDSYLSAIAALALAENLGTQVLELLLETLDVVHGDAKEAIVIAIATTRANNIREILLTFLEHSSPFVRLGAVKGIKAYMDDNIWEKLMMMRDTDGDVAVRLEAGLS